MKSRRYLSFLNLLAFLLSFCGNGDFILPLHLGGLRLWKIPADPSASSRCSH